MLFLSLSFPFLYNRLILVSGNSKYHYYGIQVKSNSPLMKQLPFDDDFLTLPDANNELDYIQLDNQSINLSMSPDDDIFSPLSTNQHSSMDMFFANDPLPILHQQPVQFNIDDLKLFERVHDDYASKLFEFFIKFRYQDLETTMQQFWSLTNPHLSPSVHHLFNNGSPSFVFRRREMDLREKDDRLIML
jgi:hypothetical protein